MGALKAQNSKKRDVTRQLTTYLGSGGGNRCTHKALNV